MRKEIEKMSERELLMELVEEKRRAEKWRLVRLCAVGAVVLALAILCAVYVPRIVESVQRFNEAVTSLQNTTNQIQSFYNGVKDAGLDKLSEAAENIDAAAQEAKRIMDGLSEAGLGDLKDSLAGLNDFAEKVRGFFGK